VRLCIILIIVLDFKFKPVSLCHVIYDFILAVYTYTHTTIA